MELFTGTSMVTNLEVKKNVLEKENLRNKILSSRNSPQGHRNTMLKCMKYEVQSVVKTINQTVQKKTIYIYIYIYIIIEKHLSQTLSAN